NQKLREFLKKALRYRKYPRQLLINGDVLGVGPGAICANIDKSSTFRNHFFYLKNYGIQIFVLTTVVEGIRRKIKDAHYPRFCKIDKGSLAVYCHLMGNL